MKRLTAGFVESIFSFAVFAVITLAVASTTYQVLNPDGGLILWMSHAWQSSPAMLVLLGGGVLVVKRWLGGHQGAQFADVMFYAAIALGLYYGFSLLTAA